MENLKCDELSLGGKMLFSELFKMVKGLWLSIKAKEDWQGKIVFDIPRHKIYMKLPLDWTSINQLPEWFVVDVRQALRFDEFYA